MTIIVVAAALLGLAGILAFALTRSVRKDLERQHANVRALESRAASVKHADRLRVQSAMHEDRSLVRKLALAIADRAPNTPPGPASHG